MDIQERVSRGDRPHLSREFANQTEEPDNKMLFYLSVVQSCWSQDSNSRPFAKDLVKQLRGLMELESYPYIQTDIIGAKFV